MKTLIKTLGGSRAYGLHNENSDFDYRGVFVHTDLSKVIYFDREETFTDPNADDSVYYEIAHFFKLLLKGSTVALEILFADPKNWIVSTEEWCEIHKNRHKFLDYKKILDSTLGYFSGEKAVTFSEKTGKLGSKRKEAILKYGYSPKNAVQAIRLCEATRFLIKNGEFPLSFESIDHGLYSHLRYIKNTPQQYSKEEIYEKLVFHENRLVELKNQLPDVKVDKNLVVSTICDLIYSRLKDLD